MKGMIYKDGKFISVLTDIKTENLYEELPRNKKAKETKSNKRGRPSKKKAADSI